jgi:hypothetical protein
VKRAFRLSTLRIMRSHSSGSSRGYCWFTGIGHTRGTEICELDMFVHAHLSHPCPPQDCQLLLQEHCLYRCPLVVPNLLWLEFTIVRSRTVPSTCTDIGVLAFSSIPTSCGGTRSGRLHRSLPLDYSTASLVCGLPAIVVALSFIPIYRRRHSDGTA